MQNVQLEVTDEYDKEFILLIMEIEKRYDKMSKHDKLRVESWCKKLCQVTNNKEWKKNRNLHAICLLDMVLNNKFEAPYNKFAPEGSVPIISKALVKSKLSNKFFENTNFSEANSGKIPLNENSNVIPAQGQTFEDKKLPNKNMNINANVNIYAPPNKSNVQKEPTQIIATDYQKELDRLRLTLEKLKTDLKIKDEIIQRQSEEKAMLDKRVLELEKMLSTFLVRYS